MHVTRRSAPLLFACALALAGCSAAANPTPPAPVTSPASIPPGGVALTALAGHAPPGFWLPVGHLPVEVIDQANVVALLFDPAQATGVVDHLVTNGSSMGFTVTDHNQTSVHLTAPGWDAAFTSSPAAAGLTLRRTEG